MTSSINDQFEWLHARAFKGILLDAAVARMEDAATLVKTAVPTSESLVTKYEDYFSLELRTRAERMTRVYGLSYCFENSVRDLVSQRLLERNGAAWWDEVPEKVRKRVEQLKLDAEQNKWHQAAVAENIDFTLFGDLANVIVAKWQEFEDLFPSQHWVKQRLDELERSRNVIAHGNVLSDSEIDRIEQYLDDWLRQAP